MAEEYVEEGKTQEAQAAVAPPDWAEQLDAAKKQAAEYKDNWMRAAADLQNFRKRVERERADWTDFATAALISKLLDVMDGFDAAFKVVPESFRQEPWVEGIRLVEQKLRNVLAQEKVKPIEALGKQFDPNYHEAMWEEESAGHSEGQVLSEFQRGYMLGERVLRPTRVKVAKAPGQTNTTNKTEGSQGT